MTPKQIDIPCHSGECKDIKSVNLRFGLIATLVFTVIVVGIVAIVNAKSELNEHKTQAAAMQSEQNQKLIFHKEMIDNLTKTNEKIFKELSELNKSISRLGRNETQSGP